MPVFERCVSKNATHHGVGRYDDAGIVGVRGVRLARTDDARPAGAPGERICERGISD